MTVPEERDNLEDVEPDSSVKRVTDRGLSPAVEKMFGALVDEPIGAGRKPVSTQDARPAARPGAA